MARAPPMYGEHVLDQLYAGLSQTGYATPMPQSGVNTPHGLLSRSGSSENLAAEAAEPAASPAFTPSALRQRLQNLSITNSSFLRRHGHYSDHSSARSQHRGDRQAHSEGSTNLPRNHSDGALYGGTSPTGILTPPHMTSEDISANLSKVPSYSTAVRTPAPPRNHSLTDMLPAYDVATSTPPSPTRRYSEPVSITQDSNEERTRANSGSSRLQPDSSSH